MPDRLVWTLAWRAAQLDRAIAGGTEYVYITADVDEADVKPVARQVITIQDADITVTMVEDVT